MGAKNPPPSSAEIQGHAPKRLVYGENRAMVSAVRQDEREPAGQTTAPYSAITVAAVHFVHLTIIFLVKSPLAIMTLRGKKINPREAIFCPGCIYILRSRKTLKCRK